MTIATLKGPMTSEELWNLPEPERYERWLIEGELRERNMTLRTPWHGRPTGIISQLLGNWCDEQPAPAPVMMNGDIYFRLARNPDTNVGIDVALATPEQIAGLRPGMRFLEGPPLLAVEVLSGSDTQDDVDEKIESYLRHGTTAVWIVNPRHRTVTVYRPTAAPVLYNDTQELIGDPVLPGFRCPVARIFRFH